MLGAIRKSDHAYQMLSAKQIFLYAPVLIEAAKKDSFVSSLIESAASICRFLSMGEYSFYSMNSLYKRLRTLEHEIEEVFEESGCKEMLE